MPTAAKIVAAICFAIFGAVAAQISEPVFPEGTQFGYFVPITAILGLLTGWIVMGGLTGRGYRDAAGSGVRTAITLLVWALLLFSCYQMIVLSTKGRYNGPMDAVVAAFGIMLANGKLLITPKIIGTFLVGGMLAGVVAEWAGKRWR